MRTLGQRKMRMAILFSTKMKRVLRAIALIGWVVEIILASALLKYYIGLDKLCDSP